MLLFLCAQVHWTPNKKIKHNLLAIMASARFLGFLIKSAIRQNKVSHNACRAFCERKSSAMALTSDIQKQQNPIHALAGLDQQIDWDREMTQILEEEKNYSVLAPVKDEHSITAEPYLRPTFNLAAYVPKSETLQQMIKLGVNLSKIERRRGVSEFIIGLDFERDMKPHILFLTQTIGLSADCLGTFLTKNPFFFKMDLDDLQVRVNYLQSKRFSSEQITEIVRRNPFWLMFSTQRIDQRLGFFQKEFSLKGNEVRQLAVNKPTLITHSLMKVRRATFSIREEMCLEKDEVKSLILRLPKLWLCGKMIHATYQCNNEILEFQIIADSFDLMERYQYIIRTMNVPLNQLLKMPNILATRLFRIRERHEYLRSLGKAQYNPKLDLYVSLDILITGSNEEFAQNVAKTSYKNFEDFLKTM